MKTSLWLSVDPLAEKYPNVGGYVYCINNPILLKDPDGKDPITAVLEGATAFGIEAGLDFATRMISGESAGDAFNNINWKGAAFEGVKTIGISVFLPTGSATAVKIANLTKSKAGKFALKLVTNLVSEVAKNYAKGDYDEEGFGKEQMLDATISALVSTLIDQGMGDKADELFEMFSKSNSKLSKQYEKLAKNMRSRNVTQDIVNKRVKKIDQAAKELLKNGVKVVVGKVEVETTKKVIDESQKEIRK